MIKINTLAEEEIDKININPALIQPATEIKTLGSFDVNLNLHSEIQSKIKLKVIPKEENQ